MKTQVAAIEFGTSKIVTVIAQSGGLSRCDIVGSGTEPYDGYMGGSWNTPEQLLETVRASIAAAEADAGEQISEIYVGVPGEYIRVRCGEAEIEIAGDVTEDDVNDVQDRVADRLHIEDEGGYVLHRSPAWFTVDDGKKTMAPRGARGSRLRGCVSFIVADPGFIEDISDLMSGLNITILGFLAPTLGESLLLLSPDDRDRAGLLVNVGYLNTEVSAVEGDAVTYHAILPLGAGQITGELMDALELPLESAEQIKRGYIFNPDEFDSNAYFEVEDAEGRRVSLTHEEVQRVMEANVDELCDMIDQTIKNDANAFLGPRSQVFLTGGGLALMRGGREYLAGAIGRAVKVPMAKSAKLNSPVYSSALGLVDLIFDSIEQQDAAESGLGDKLKSLFRRS